MTYRVSLVLGAFFATATKVVHSWMDPGAIDPLWMRLFFSAVFLAAAGGTWLRDMEKVRAAVVGSLCIFCAYVGWLCGVNELSGPWPHAFFTGFIAPSLVVGPFAHSARVATWRIVALGVCIGVSCIWLLDDAVPGLVAGAHVAIIGTFIALISTIHIGTRTKLVAARDGAMQATQVKAQFLANMSHEIRTPVNGVIGTASLLEDGTLRPDQAELVSTLNSSGEALLAIINDILDLSKVEAGAIEIESAPFPLRDLLLDVATLLKPVAVGRGNSLEIRIGDVPASVVGDAFRVRQVITNLLSNAIKFTDDGVVELEAHWANGQLSMAVRDTGIGIAPERVASVFESFRQADESTTRRFGGTGLGLTISREIVGCMGGTIDVASELGEGTEFTVVIPLPRVEPVAEAADSPIRAADDAGSVPTGQTCAGMHVLLVDDNPVNRRVAGKMLERLGATPVMAVDGLEAVSMATSGGFDLILMDIQMPNLDGLEATRLIRNLPFQEQPWIVALTAGATPEDRQASEAAGANAYLTKPVRLEELRAAIEAAKVAIGAVGAHERA